jgi:alcohol dehydrogenase (NADP+)
MQLTTIALLLSLALTEAQYIYGLGPIQPPKGVPIAEIPIVGFGTWGITNRAQGIDAIARAMQKGFRHFDGAAIYENEELFGAGLAEGMKRTGLKREDFWVTTKIWNDRHGKLAGQGLQESLNRLNLTYVDMLLMHVSNSLYKIIKAPK